MNNDQTSSCESESDSKDLTSLAESLSLISMALGNGVSKNRVLETFEQLKIADITQLNFKLFKKTWLRIFPKSSVTEKSIESLGDDDFPCLIKLEGNNGFCICKSISQGKAYILTQDDDSEIPTSQILGKAFVFKLSKIRKSRTPLNAGDFFRLGMRSHKKVINEAILASFVAAILGVGSALYTMQVYDRVVPTGAFSTLTVLAIGVGIAILLEFFAKQIKSGFVDRATESLDLSLSQLFFEKGIDLRLESRPKTVGTLAAQIKNFEMIRQFMITSLFFIWADLPFAIFFLGVIWFIGGNIVLVPLILLPIGVLFGLLLRNPIERNTKLNMEESNKKSGLLIEVLDGIETVKSTGGRNWFTSRWYDLSKTVSVGEFRVKRLSAIATNVSQTMQQVSYAGMVTYGAVLVTQGELTMGALIACTILSGRALGPLSQFPNMIAQAKKSKIALDALNGIMKLPVDRDINHKKVVLDKCTGKLSVDPLVFAYDQQPVVSFPALVFPPGQKVAILGAVGSGKSTLLRMLAGLYKPSEGHVRLDDYDLNTLAEDYLREQIHYLPQDVRLFGGSLRDNLTLGLPMVSESELASACEKTGLSKVIAKHPMGLDLTIHEGGQGLSTGQRQLVGITRLMLAKPKLIMLDEPTSAMDRLLEQQLLATIFKEHSQATIVMVTHKINHLEFVERAAVVDQGQMVMDGPKDEVLKRLTGNAAKESNA